MMEIRRNGACPLSFIPLRNRSVYFVAKATVLQMKKITFRWNQMIGGCLYEKIPVREKQYNYKDHFLISQVNMGYMMKMMDVVEERWYEV